MSSNSARTSKGTLPSLIAVLAPGACSSDLVQPRVEVSFQIESVGVENPVFIMTQNGVPSEVMEALFEGQAAFAWKTPRVPRWYGPWTTRAK